MVAKNTNEAAPIAMRPARTVSPIVSQIGAESTPAMPAATPTAAAANGSNEGHDIANARIMIPEATSPKQSPRGASHRPPRGNGREVGCYWALDISGPIAVLRVDQSVLDTIPSNAVIRASIEGLPEPVGSVVRPV